jgi:hypothetical protein
MNKKNAKYIIGFLLLGFWESAQGASVAQSTATVSSVEGGGKAAESLDVDIVGETKDDVPFTKLPPLFDIPLHEIASLSREGQTERVLMEPVEHMSERDKMRLHHRSSRQVAAPLPVKIPEPPLFYVEVTPGLTAYLWELHVIDQDNEVIKGLEGTSLPKGLVEWDGFVDGVFKVKVGQAYTPLLILSDSKGKKQRYFGDPVRLDVFQYQQDDFLHVEFSIDKLFEKKADTFSAEMSPYLNAALDVMRQHRRGEPFRITLYALEGGLTQKRLDNLQKFFLENLMLEPNDLNLSIMTPGERGEIVDIMMLANPEGKNRP